MTPLDWRAALSRWQVAPWPAGHGYLLLSLHITAPARATFSTRYIGAESGDIYALAQQAWWVKSALQTGEDLFYQPLLLYPAGTPAPQLWANPLAYFPAGLLALVLPLAAACNLVVILTLTGNGMAMLLLARRHLRASAQLPAFIAGAVYLASPAMQSLLIDGQIGALMQWSLPLLIICLYSYADRGGKRRYLRAALFFALVALGGASQLAYASLPIAFLFMLARWLRRDQVGAARALAVVLGGCALLLLYLAPALGEILRQPLPAAADTVRHSIDLLDIVSPATGLAAASNAAYIGLLGGFLAILGILGRRAARWWLLLAFVAWLLALGPLLQVAGEALTIAIVDYETIVPLPFAALLGLPLFQLAGQPDRFLLLFTLAFALLAGFGADVLWSSRLMQRRRPWLRLALAGAILLLLVEEYDLAAEMPSAPANPPQAIHDLSARAGIRAIYNLPYDEDWSLKQALYLQTAHGKPIFSGGSHYAEAADKAQLDLLSRFDPALLWRAGADIVIIHKAPSLDAIALAQMLRRARQQLGEPIHDDENRSVFQRPIARAVPPLLYATQADENSHTTYIYKAQPGWLELNATLEAVNRRVNLSLNDTLLDSLVVNGKIPLSLPLPLARRGYHSLRIELEPPCPPRIDATLFCHDITVELVDIQALSTGTIYDPIRLEDDIILAGYYLPDQADEELAVRFWWRFEAPRSSTDVRFVHLLDVAGRLVPGAQDDKSLGALQAGAELTETVRFDTRFLPAGDYRVLTGWYRLPDAIRFDVLTNVPGAQDNTIQLGIVRVGG
ncbi:MAG: hypothetical protein F4Z94_11015 [Chloroflexi bacterium]|nr:hypothetical protein [Chloroflexota bacterium]